MSTFSGSKPTQGVSNERSVTWNDESTLGAPCEDSEYGAGDPERVLELSAGNSLQYGGKSLVEKNQTADDTSIAELMKHQHHQHRHQYSISTGSFPLHK